RLAQRVWTVGLGAYGLLGPVVGVDGHAAVGRLHPGGVDALVRAAPTGQLQQFGAYVDLGEVDGYRPRLLGQAEPERFLVDRHHHGRPEHPGAVDRELPDRAGAPDGDHVGGLDVAH